MGHVNCFVKTLSLMSRDNLLAAMYTCTVVKYCSICSKFMTFTRIGLLYSHALISSEQLKTRCVLTLTLISCPTLKCRFTVEVHLTRNKLPWPFMFHTVVQCQDSKFIFTFRSNFDK